MKRYLYPMIFSFCLSAGLKAQQQKVWGDWTVWGEQAGGMYMNPVIPSDYSDIDCIRGGGRLLCHIFYFPVLSGNDGLAFQGPGELGNLWECC